MPEKVDPDSGVATESQSERKLKRPQLYKVLFHNDNYTTRDFVVAVLREVFHKSESDAVAIMLHVHNSGIGVAGVYTYDVARTKIDVVEALAREHEFPLRLTMEPEEI
ncbi:MAG TPA: ATP-dependent Clp protease adaptor ClpS [Myxococcaceae bacterium]|jgi:ATP-dependent Clp protease adaptor protein ClpS|nr:ATP-dependent Clp protease adaptor ClpS [Myxococcaceae bacterium]